MSGQETTGGMSRRGFIAAAGAAAAGIAAAGLLGGCAGGEFDVSADWLPVGSIVKLNKFKDAEAKHMVVARKPLATGFVNSKGEVEGAGTQVYRYDYACVLWPYGLLMDLSDIGHTVELLRVNRSDIAEVVHVGYTDDSDRSAADKLSGAEHDATAVEVLAEDAVAALG